MSARFKPGQKRTKRDKRRDAKYMQLRRKRAAFWRRFDEQLDRNIENMWRRWILDDAKHLGGVE